MGFSALPTPLGGTHPTRGFDTLSGVLNPAEADQLGFLWVGDNYRTIVHSNGVLYESADGLRKYRPPSATIGQTELFIYNDRVPGKL